MAIVVFNETSYECTRAVKGVDYIKLYDENNNIIVAFEGVSDFSEFILQEGVWEKGISTDAVSASAKLVNSSIQLDLLKRLSVETGLLITFQAPCNCTETSGLVINGVEFALVDAAGNALAADVEAFTSDAMVSVILNTDANLAYVQNAAESESIKQLKESMRELETSFEELALANINNLVIQKFTKSRTWEVPRAKNQLFKIIAVGGGGGGGMGVSGYSGGGGGGGGFISVNEVVAKNGGYFSFTCGAGGAAGSSNGDGSDGGSTTVRYPKPDGEHHAVYTVNGGAGGISVYGGASSTPQAGGNGGNGGGGGGGGRGYLTAKAGNGGRGYFGGGGGGGSACNHDNVLVADTYQGSGGAAGPYGGKGGSALESLDAECTGADVSIIDLLFEIDRYVSEYEISDPSTSKTNGAGTSFGGVGGVFLINGSIMSYYGGGGGGGLCSQGGAPGPGGGGGGSWCGKGGKGSQSGGGGGGFFCNGGDASNTHGGGGGGFFSDGDSSGNGGNGGVLIMYIREDS